MKSNLDFKNFQMGFMIGGSTLMLMGPALSIFYVDTLQLTHEGISNVCFLFMRIGVILSSFLWRKSLEKMSPDHAAHHDRFWAISPSYPCRLSKFYLPEPCFLDVWDCASRKPFDLASFRNHFLSS